ncbi:hypothetical protein VTL71DRAFT_1892 [Oculimacula yallundae]|uniref:Uncharacterized protein n=1 Tax=Oculimacula yallundae TaxID=86028 RepID=A0ABR4CCR0_9HELO
MDTSTTQQFTVADLRNNAILWYKINVLIYDLRNFSTVLPSQNRLDSVLDPSYLGPPYFTAPEAQTIKRTLVDTSKPVHPSVKAPAGQDGKEQNLRPLEEVIEDTLKERLERRIKKREESGDFRVCAAHDLAPILERAFGVNGKEVEKDMVFLDVVERWGLELKEGVVWMDGKKKGGGKSGKGKKGRH